MTAAIQPYHLNVDEFVAFCSLDPDRYRRFELIEGEIWEPMPESIQHADMVETVAAAMRRRYPDRLVRSHGSVQLDGDGLVLPDVYVLRAGAEAEGSYWNGRQLELAVEVSLSTWAQDVGTRLRNYARGGVPCYYVIELTAPEPRVHVHQEPRGDAYLSVVIKDMEALLP